MTSKYLKYYAVNNILYYRQEDTCMADRRVGTLVLEGQDSVNFVNSLIRPSYEQIDHFKNVFQRIDDTIQISENGDGFTANVADFDLSFLHTQKEESINVK